MSHFTRVRTTLRDATTLAAALRAVGYPQVEVHERPQRLKGWGAQTAQAEVIVRRASIPGHAIGDFGFARQEDGTFAVVMDSMDSGRNGPGWLTSLTRAYGHAAALQYASEHGYDVVTDEVEGNGTRRLTLRRYASP
jgi:hypothetical protein